MKNKVVHFEIGAEDPKELAEFYKKAFGWEINEWPGSNYWMVGSEKDREVGAINGGIMKRFKEEKTINTISVEDIDATITAVTDNGGKIVKDKADMPMSEGEIMRWAYLEDPQGNTFGLMQIIKNEK